MAVTGITLNQYWLDIYSGGTFQFSATVDGSTQGVTWSCTGGTITPDGLFTAGAVGMGSVTATSVEDPSFSATTDYVNIMEAVSVVLDSPTQAEMSCAPGEQLTVAAHSSGGMYMPDVSWSIKAGSGGSISQQDMTTAIWTAPNAPGTHYLVATSYEDATKKAEVTVTVEWPPVSVNIAPAAILLKPGGSMQFTATVTGGDGTNLNVSWSVAEAGGGEVADGLYTAPAGTGTYHVVATSLADGTKSATAAVDVHAEAWLPGWKARKPVTVAAGKVAGDIEGFRMLVSMTDAHLKDTANGGRVAFPDGRDIAFALFDGIPLAYDREFYDSVTGELRAWVKVPNVLASVDNTIYLYLGKASAAEQENKAACWNDYAAVWHMQEESGDMLDSSGNGLAFAVEGTTPVDSPVGRGRYFDSVDDRAIVSSIDMPDEFSFSYWYKTDQTGSEVAGFQFDVNGTRISTLESGKPNIGYGAGAGSTNSMWSFPESVNVNKNDWMRLDFIVDSIEQTTRLYVNGVQATSQWYGTFSVDARMMGTTRLSISYGMKNSYPNVGGPPRSYSHTSIRSGLKLPAVVAAEYANQSDPSIFYTVGALETDTPPVESVSITPETASIYSGGSVGITASVTGGDGASGVTWSTPDGGTFADGVFTADTPGTYQVVATSVEDNTKSDTATITVYAPVSISVAPGAANIYSGGTQQFTVEVTGGMGDTSVTWTAPDGGIVMDGLFTAPEVPGVYRVMAASMEDSTRSTTSTVTVYAPVSLTVTSAASKVYAGGTMQLEAEVAGGMGDASVTWSADRGIVDESGLYTAPAAPGDDTVTATSVEDDTKSAAAEVTVLPAPSGLVFFKGTLFADGVEFGELQDVSLEMRSTGKDARGKDLYSLDSRTAEHTVTLKASTLTVSAASLSKIFGGAVAWRDGSTVISMEKASMPDTFSAVLKSPSSGEDLEMVFYKVRPVNPVIPVALKEFSAPNFELEVMVGESGRVFDVMLPGNQS